MLFQRSERTCICGLLFAGLSAGATLLCWGTASAARAVTREQQFTAIGDYINCVLEEQQRLDNEKSSIATVAAAIEPNCMAQYSSMKSVLGATMALGSAQAMDQQLDQSQLQMISNLVARARAGQSPIPGLP